MIKAVFFDWFNTLARYDPPREELQSQVLEEFGIHVSPQKIMPALLIADKNYFEENAILPMRNRSPEEQSKVWLRYQTTVLTEAGIDVPEDPATLLKILKRGQELQGSNFTLFDDVLSTLKMLKQRGLIIGLLTNLTTDMKPIYSELGLEPYINFVVTAGEVEADKPEPPIFLMALQRAGVNASEAVHVGDQPKIDITGARAVGITPILIDRYNLYPEVDDCTRIESLTELVQYLQ